MNRWDELSLREKSQLLGIYASKGYNDLASIISHYNSFAAGGHLYQDGGDDIAFTRELKPINIIADAPEGVKTARRMLELEKPYRNFMKAQDLDFYHKVKSTLFPLDCINTATKVITQDSTIGSNKSLYDNPEKYGYVRVHPDSIHAGDLAQYGTFDDNLFPYHAGIVVKVPDEGVMIKSANGHGMMNPIRTYEDRKNPDAYDTLMYYRYIGNKN
jgi:hypothetical protein